MDTELDDPMPLDPITLLVRSTLDPITLLVRPTLDPVTLLIRDSCDSAEFVAELRISVCLLRTRFDWTPEPFELSFVN